ncbi:hypothetical protein EZS27_019973, partial [termite gut metagenome]
MEQKNSGKFTRSAFVNSYLALT